MAFLRRIGGTVEHFGRLKRRSFSEILKKHLTGLPFSSSNGSKPDEIITRAVGELNSWFYSHQPEDPGQVAITYVGSTAPDIRYRRDFLSAGLVDRAVKMAAFAACDAESHGCRNPGLNMAMLKSCFQSQIQDIVRQLRTHNVVNYLEIPENARVQGVQPIAQPELLPAEVMKT